MINENVEKDSSGLDYFKEINRTVNNIEYLGKGEYSTTYKISTDSGDYALHIRDEMVGDYSELIGEHHEYLPLVYDVRKIDNKFYIVMELLYPISNDMKKAIDCIDYLFYENDLDALDNWLEDNLRDGDLYLKTRELLDITDIDNVSVTQYTDRLNWFYKHFDDYVILIGSIEDMFIEYNYTFGYRYSDFHGDNIMLDEYGDFKLIDL